MRSALSPLAAAAALLAFALQAFVPAAAMSAEDRTARTDAAFIADRLGDYFSALAGMKRFNGVVLWAEGERVLLFEKYEMPDLPDAGRIEKDSAFHIASIRKLFSEWLIEDAASRRELARRDPVSRFLPDFPRGDEITIAQLLEHRSGLARGESFQFEQRFYPLDEYLPLIAAHPLEFEPGTDARYSNFGYMMIDRILQAATGQHPAELLSRRLFEPVGMTASFEFHQRPDQARIATGLYEHDGSLQAVDALEAAQFETGNVFSTAPDLLAFVRHPDVRGLLAEDGRIAHAGGKRGYRSWLVHDAASDRTLVVLSNLAATPIQRVIDETDGILAGDDVPLPRPVRRERIEVETEVLQHYVGTYRVIANGQVLAVRLEGDALVVYDVSDSGLANPETIHPESRNTFFLEPDSTDTIRFVRPGDDQPPSMILTIMGGYELETERLSDAP